MALETATYISSLVETNPTGLDQQSTADDHLRLLKAAIKRTFPNVSGPVAPSQNFLNRTGDLTSSAQGQLDTLKVGKLNISATAVYSQSAGAAVSAQFATSATNATSAVYASSAGNATNAVSAVFATSATNATNAVNATNATSAAFATSARSATSAIRSNTAQFAVSYDGSVSVGQIDSASVGGVGLIELATTAEVATGTDVAKAITPASLPSGSGYASLPGGKLMQWGVSGSITDAGSGGGTGAITLPTAFADALYRVSICPNFMPEDGADGSGVTGKTTAGFNIRSNEKTNGTFDWVAIGTAP